MQSSPHDYISGMKVEEISRCIPSKLIFSESINKISKTKLHILHLIQKHGFLKLTLYIQNQPVDTQVFCSCTLYKETKTDEGINLPCLANEKDSAMPLQQTINGWAKIQDTPNKEKAQTKIKIPLTIYKNVIDKLSVVIAWATLN